MNIRTRNIIAACMLSLAVSSHASYIWWEGEDAVTNNFPRRSGFSPMNEAERAVLSEGAWLSIDGTRAEPAFAEYTVAVPAAGTYDLWVRKFWKHGPFRWRFGKGEWREVGRDVALADSVTLRPLVGANWVRCGAVKLDAGTQVFRIELTENTGAACFDCFILSPVPFTPRGKLKPDEKYGQAPEGWFTFEPGRDTFENAVLDLRGLNEREAGSQGAVFRRGDQFVFEKTGAPVAFWGVTACQNVWMMDKDDVDYLARRLAKMGVNMVRLHTSPFDESTPGPVTRKIHYLVSALKKQGIYVGINWYCLACVHVKPAWDLPELPNGYQPMSALFCYPRLQERYKAWARALFASTNEYTGMTLATDPAVAFIELIDEDNYFFWTFAPKQFPEPVRAALETQFGDWLAKRYGSIQKAKEYWGPGPAPEGAKDDPASGRMTLYPASIMTGADWAVASRNARRMRDQVEFLVASQRGFFAMMRDWLRKDLGYRSCVVPTNWKTADERVLGPLDKYTYLAGDATARNCYFSGPFKEQNGAFGFGPGDAYADRSVLNAPESAIMLEMQYADYPHVATEGGWAMPNRYRSEGPLVMAAYGALQGTDGFCPFVVEHDWVNTLPMWPIQTPAMLGQFPAAAVIYRCGLVKQGPVAIHEQLCLSNLYDLQGAGMSQDLGLDSVRQKEVPEGMETSTAGTLDQLAFCVGRVIRSISDAPPRTDVLKEMPKLIDRANRIVRSATGELTMDYGRGVLTVTAPAAQGVAGFIGAAGALDCGDIVIASSNEYATVVAVSLDGKPLKTSAKILVQAMTEENNHGWETAALPATADVPAQAATGAQKKNTAVPGMKKIASVGGPPLVVRDILATVTFKRPDAATLAVTPLDVNGCAMKTPVACTRGANGSVTVTLLPDCLYYMVTAGR